MGCGYNTISHLTLEGHNQNTIFINCDHVLIMPYTVYYLCHVELHCGAYYSNNCAVIGHFTCQTAVTELGRMSYVTRPFSSPGGWGLDMRLLTEGSDGLA